LYRVCLLFGITRQAYYKHYKKQQQIYYEEEIVLKLVNAIRVNQPRIGTRKLYYLIKEDLRKHQIMIGRDSLFDILSKYGLLVRLRKKRAYTTNSMHTARKYPNLIKLIEINKPNQVWVSDITYFYFRDSFVYIFLITDAYSKKIVGHHTASSLETINAIKPLKQAIKLVINTKGLIHHSDRGFQYCSHKYVNLLKNNAIQISMSAKGNPYENAIAERVNGIIKK